MNDRKFVLTETLYLAIGEALGVGAMFGIYALLGFWDWTVPVGGLLGLLIAVGNFFFLALTASLASRRAMEQDVEGGKKLIKSSQAIRFLAVAGLLALCAASRACDLIALVMPLLLERPILMIAEFFRKKEV